MTTSTSPVIWKPMPSPTAATRWRATSSGASPRFTWRAFTDIFSQCAENRAVWNKGAEFLNHHLWRYFLDRRAPVSFARSRPYHKDDQTHVEQKNWTHVRQRLGYERLADPELVAWVNELYRVAWNPLHNFFCPSMKLRSKHRVNARMVNKYDAPQIPDEQLLAVLQISDEKKGQWRERFGQLNPFALKKSH